MESNITKCPFCDESTKDLMELAYHLDRFCPRMARQRDFHVQRMEREKQRAKWAADEKAEVERMKRLGISSKVGY